MATRFNEKGMDDLARDPGLARFVMEVTERIAATVRADAPVDSGEYKAGIRTSMKFQERVVGLVEATDPKSLIIEAQQGVMARAVKKNARRR